ncbi:DNA-binding response regulator, NarL/FixJ family, contains REC and HTH domains [Saccharopolyspora antimicrobica]|uniref:DNA-binding NarL/FixJ family response regulator n=1 Tax=Saccharopolyspora antimicrobica TaxID=455193 RepID=A0A1I5B3Y4_9PSEU|nr:LuxR C-terminal-related transcriptional regulator [Saccharopolyspora antimicrobica]RKT86459.1 DNA-binding NarL/FixJ family response regulator [Saccharopolyspora antimicrobica]SFN69392.1 DNA-binding response regulator, NarL/FixJ family, contains REC and HTH domains [Saccharopolyspora antimicrobica]
MNEAESATHSVNPAARAPGEQVRVAVWAADPITSTGLAEMLLGTAEVFVAVDPFPADVDVLVFAADRVSPEVLARISRAAAESAAPAVLVTRQLDRAVLLRLVECRVVAVLHRGAVTSERLVGAIRDAAERGGALPNDLLGELLRQVEDLHRDVLEPRGPNSTGFVAREIDVLRLLAEGWDTEEIGKELCYSERTVKNVIYAMMSRFNLRNRAQLVAHGVRTGVI